MIAPTALTLPRDNVRAFVSNKAGGKRRTGALVNATLFGLMSGTWLGLVTSYSTRPVVRVMDDRFGHLASNFTPFSCVVVLNALSALTGILLYCFKVCLASTVRRLSSRVQRRQLDSARPSMLGSPLNSGLPASSTNDAQRGLQYIRSVFTRVVKPVLITILLFWLAAIICLGAAVCGYLSGTIEIAVPTHRVAMLSVATSVVVALMLESAFMLKPLWLLSSNMSLCLSANPAAAGAGDLCGLCAGPFKAGNIRLISPSSSPECVKHSSHLFCFLDSIEQEKCPTCFAPLNVRVEDFEDSVFSWFYFAVLAIYSRVLAFCCCKPMITHNDERLEMSEMTV